MEKNKIKMPQKMVTFLFLMVPTFTIWLMSGCASTKTNSKKSNKQENLFFADKVWLCDIGLGVNYLDCYDYTDSMAAKFTFGKMSVLFTKSGLYQEGVLLDGKDGLSYISLDLGKWQLNHDTIVVKYNRLYSFKNKVEIIDSCHIKLVSID